MQKIVIFGAGSAIAQATTRLLAEDKSHIVLVDQDSEKLSIIASDLTTRGSKTETITTDLSNTQNHPSLWQEIKIKFAGTPDIILIAYGTLGNEDANKNDFSIAGKELQVNFISVVSLLTLMKPDFEKAGSGTIIAISSVAGDRGRQRNYVYGSAKGGLTTYLSGMRTYMYKKGVTVITIKPGFVDTPMTAHFKKGILWAQPATIAKGIVSAIKHKKPVVYLPWFWRYIMVIICLIPEKIFQKMKI